MRVLLLALCALSLCSCAAFDRTLDIAAIAGEVAVAGHYVTAEEVAPLKAGVEVARAASAEAQGKAEDAAAAVAASHEAIQAVDEEGDWGYWLGIAGVAAAAARGIPSKGPLRAVVQALTPKQPPQSPPPQAA